MKKSALKQLFPGKNAIKDSLLISIRAMVTTTPVVLYYFFQFPNYCIIINFIILLFITVLTLSTLLAGFIGMLSYQWMDKGLPVQYIKAGDYIVEGALKISCLHPSLKDIGIISNARSTVKYYVW